MQPPAPLDLWESDPFELTIRDGWAYARGIADDKGQLFILLKAAQRLVEANALPVNLRFACDGEEEIGGHTIVDYLSQDEGRADVAVIFDGLMLRRDLPVFDLATRGLIAFEVKVRTGERDLHSGMYGGAAMNAIHVLMRLFDAVLAGPDGRLPEPLREGIAPPTAEELAEWAKLAPGADELAGQGAQPLDDKAADEFYLRTWAQPSADVNGILGGKPGLRNTTLMLRIEGYRTWGELLYVLKTGQPAFEHIHGKSRWEKLAEDPEDSARFNAAMVELTTRVAQAFVAAYDFTGMDTVVDVAGGNGALLAAVLQSNAEMDGILFDLPAGLAGAVERMNAAGLSGRVRLTEGSFFESVPSGADLYMLKSIIHDWDDAHARKILETCREAMLGEARLVLVERLVPERIGDDENVLATVMSDLHMMVALGGRERTTAEYRELFDAAGLRLTREIPMASDFHAIEAVRA